MGLRSSDENIEIIAYTPARTPKISVCTKISGLETNIFELKMMVKSGLEIFYLEILLAPS